MSEAVHSKEILFQITENVFRTLLYTSIKVFYIF